VNYAYVAAAVAVLLVGFLAGLLTFKRSLQWCPACGATLRCPDCGNLVRRATSRRPTPSESNNL
jgi:hypothetical protein